MTRKIDHVEFGEADLKPAVRAVDEVRTVGRGWVNLRPGIRPEDAPPAASGLLALLGSRPMYVPLCTWVPGKSGQPDELGVQHASGTRAALRLVEHGAGPRPGWVVRQDHPRRGLVIAIGAQELPREVVAWLVAAAHLLTRVPLTGWWLADVHRAG